MTTETKTASKKSQATAIFQSKLIEREQGLYASNKDFRAAVLDTVKSTLGVSTASASTMYNATKKEAETAGITTLGRDPKKVKITTVIGKRGRPNGSRNKEKVVDVPVGNITVSHPVAGAEVVA